MNVCFACFIIVQLFNSCLLFSQENCERVIGLDTMQINGRMFRIGLCKGKGNITSLFIVREGDTIITRNDYNPVDREFVDVNNDGFIDIMFRLPGNVSGINDLYIYKSVIDSFILIPKFNDFPEPMRVLKTKFFYSYMPVGCADMNWESDLFYIRGVNVNVIGKINAVECSLSNRSGIYIYRVGANGKKVLLNKLKKNDYDKWQFIQSYWSLNYKKFYNSY